LDIYVFYLFVYNHLFIYLFIHLFIALYLFIYNPSEVQGSDFVNMAEKFKSCQKVDF